MTVVSTVSASAPVVVADSITTVADQSARPVNCLRLPRGRHRPRVSHPDIILSA